MDFNFIDAGIAVPMNSEGYVSVVHFSWNNNQTHKLFWDCTKNEAIKEFKNFASEYNSHIDQDVYVRLGFTDYEFLFDTTTQSDAGFTLQSMIFETLTNPEPEKLNALMSFFEINEKKEN